MKDTYNNAINEYELEKELVKFADNNNYMYVNDVYITALFLNEENERRFAETGEYWFIPRALIPIAFEAWWQLEHNVDSYGCDYDWVFSDEGMRFILVEDKQCDINWWGKTEEDFVDYWNL